MAITAGSAAGLAAGLASGLVTAVRVGLFVLVIGHGDEDSRSPQAGRLELHRPGPEDRGLPKPEHRGNGLAGVAYTPS